MSSSEEFVYLYRIENFSMAPHKVSEFIRTPTFHTKMFDNTAWSLHIYPRGNKQEAEEYVSCFLQREQDKGPDVLMMSYDLELLASDSSSQETRSITDKSMKLSDNWGFSKFVKREALFSCSSVLLPRDMLSIRCRMWRSWPADLAKQDLYLRTRVSCDTMDFFWRVRDVSKLNRLHIRRFVVRYRTPEFALVVYVSDNGELAAQVHLADASLELTSPVVASCRIAIVDRDGRETDLQRKEFHVFEKADAVWNFPTFVTKKTLEERGYIMDDALTLSCSMSKSTGANESRLEKSVYGELAGDSMTEDQVLNKNMRQLLEGDRYHDVKLKVGDDSLLAHRFLLHARSPVLREVLVKHDPGSDGEVTEVVTQDVADLATLRRMLVYMYSEHLDLDLDYRSLIKLFVAASTYQVIDLKEKCTSLLVQSLDLTNAHCILLVGRLYSVPELQECAVDFFADNWDEVSLSEEWEDFVRDDPDVASEVRRQIRGKRLKE